MYERIIFMQDSEGYGVVDALTHTESLVVNGVSPASVEATVDYLSQWDNGEGDVERVDALDMGYHDRTAQVDHYMLTWNVGLGHVALYRIIDEDGETLDVTTCRTCDEPVDYCLDHTHAPDMESEDWQDDYDRTRARLQRSGWE